MTIEQDHAESFVDWLMHEVISQARGDRHRTLKVRPDGRLWLGRIAPEVKVRQNRLGERGERLEPCEIGLQVRPSSFDGRSVACRVRLCAWRQISDSEDPSIDKWEKTKRLEVRVSLPTPTQLGEITRAGRQEFATALADVGAAGLEAELHAEVEQGKGGKHLVLSLVNTSPEKVPLLDTNLYEVAFAVAVGDTIPFKLEELEDIFRYDRDVQAYGLNGGVRLVSPGVFVTSDFAAYDRKRSQYWDGEIAGEKPELTFVRLASDPEPPLRELVDCLERWNDEMWSEAALTRRGFVEGWEPETLEFALDESKRAREEAARIRIGVDLLARDDRLRRAFMLANESFARCRAIRHTMWRPFQLGFVLANLAALHPDKRDEENCVVDTLWFATGGGKTETYLLYTMTAAFYDRLSGKREGISSWARFPLRMLSLDQTQRFADVFAAAELVRSEQQIAGDIFSVGFFVGQEGTPNRIPPDPKANEPDPKDPKMPARYRVLIRCPFCTSEDLEMRFDRRRWALDHICNTEGCPWQGQSLPFRIVDDEIYRWLPTVVLGTLDKAASVAIQAAMRAFYGAPSGKCPVPWHGFTYSPRWKGKVQTCCLYPGCSERPRPLPQNANLYPPTIRIQDELHLLRDSLGSVDAHYEALLDDLQRHWGSKAKVIASSATLAGHEEQVDALYRRRARTFPLPGPRANRSFWSQDSDLLTRRYVGVAPRGVTLEYAHDQMMDTLQRSIRRALTTPDDVALEAGVPVEALPGLISAYGVDVVYGSTLKDVEAVSRSFETQIQIDHLNPATLTGRTPLEEVRLILKRLKNPEASFYERLHLVAASSMLSHGVDIDRLNVMIMLGLPLSTAEFIQTTARVGRRYPGIVFVLHKIARERDAAVFRIFPSFIEHMDRLIDPVPITSKSRRVLELTFSGLEQARIYGIHEPVALQRGLKPLTRPGSVKKAFLQLPVIESRELQDLIETLGITGPLDHNMRRDLEEYVRQFFRALNDPASSADWVNDLFPTGAPMMSLRDVEDQVDVYSRGGDS